MKPPTRDTIKKVIEIFKEKDRKRREFIEKFGHIKPPTVVKDANGKTVSALENGIYFQAAEQDYNFSNVIHDHALIFFGDAFLTMEESKAFEDRHPAIQWLHTVCAHDEKIFKMDGVHHDRKRIGLHAAWLRFANDLFTIRDNSRLEALLKKRLMKSAKFQGARHELRVAALCIAAGFKVEFEDDMDNSSLHPEFIAVDKFSSIRVAVEAKSRHRRGVLGFSEGPDEVPGESVKIKNLVLSAYKKQTGLPLYVFIDVNLPPASVEFEDQRWLGEILDTMMELASKGYTDPCPANAIFFCNDPSHFITDRPLNDVTDHLWIKHFTAEVPRIDHPNSAIVERFMKAYTQRVAGPDAIDFC